MTEPDSKRKKPNYYMQKKRKQFILEPGLKGFLCTCNFREKECVRESYNLLNSYADSMVAGTTKEESSESEDIADDLKKELAVCKDANRKRFQVVESGAKNLLFIRTTIAEPVRLATTIICDIASSGQQKTRFLLRLIPIETTCRANLADVKSAAISLFDKYFDNEAKSFAVAFNHRNNNQLNRDEVVKELAGLIAAKNPKHKVDLKNADLTVIVEVIRGICLLAVVPDYFKYKKYNLLQLVDSVQKSDKEIVNDSTQ